MPPATDAAVILEHPSHAPEYYKVQTLPRVLPSSRHKHALLTYLRSVITLARRGYAHLNAPGRPRARDMEMPTDILARKYPYMYIKALSG